MPPFVFQKLALVLVLCFTAVSEAQLRVATWNCAALRGDLSAIRDILVEIAEDDTTGWSTPPAVLILQEVNEGDQFGSSRTNLAYRHLHQFRFRWSTGVYLSR